MRYALKLCYFGNSEEYEGFQRQENKNTIEGNILDALKKAKLIEEVDSANYAAAGRTDRGVHALSQVIAISTPEKLIIPAINSFLPNNIVVWAEKVVDEKFHPRYDAFSRYYRYYTSYANENLDLMREGALLLEGRHDFKLFRKKQPKKSPIREIFQIRIEKKDPFLIFHIMANSFLWKMVRRIIDALLKIGELQWGLEDLKSLLNLNPKPNIYTTPRPINGLGALILWDIEYPFKFQVDPNGLTRVKMLLYYHLSEFALKGYYTKDIFEFFNSINEK
ncbi:MAG: tRNA pseudouridine(38-40) synthase TruA [Candidatus Helarchaeota archaeon]|nr:tRNA pseudouridine(38-40) synthase TruA [Candidatus Helarchaeota archaeon]